jgi:diaminopimelate decarboxylase
MAGLVDGIDVASAGELKVALDAGADPAEISFAGPGKRDPELRQAVAAGCWSMWNRARTGRAGRAYRAELGLPARVAVRVNPDFELKGSGMKMGGGPKQFGVDVEQVPERAGRIGRAGPAVRGLPPVRRLAEPEGRVDLRGAATRATSWPAAGRTGADAPVRFLNLGGGFGIPYFPGEQPLDLAPIGANLARCRTCSARVAAGRHRDRAGPLPGRRGRACTSPASSTARSRAARCSWSPTAA